ncbi:hypothetical protein AUJ22_01335 [Candidatus Nomurabacteria bacterium CG1_02_31_12]|uniref:Uncharacterized protein n=1 Tax=Candidatus Nomurabacteria bacterium CG1_02_31_12 TaxID=1805280 RepID=A0A1J4V4G1_9BACT|nr:MAG: hypothetical protein AUJ22_01335 [Candidatus Nomurabacteria bacterium CG1_02_31_12]
MVDLYLLVPKRIIVFNVTGIVINGGYGEVQVITIGELYFPIISCPDLGIVLVFEVIYGGIK